MWHKVVASLSIVLWPPYIARVQVGPDRSKIQGVDPEQTNTQMDGKLKLLYDY